MCRGVASFDFVSGQGVGKNAPVLSNAELDSMLWKKCELSTDLVGPAAAGREAVLSPEKQMMQLRMLAPHLTVNSTQVQPSVRSLLSDGMCTLHLALCFQSDGLCTLLNACSL